MGESLRAAVVQLCSRQDVEQNLGAAERWVERAAEKGATLVVLPENFCFLGGLKQKAALAESLEGGGPILSRMQALARRASVDLLLGGMPTRADGAQAGCFFNTAVLLASDGEVVSSYNKIHLFDIDIPDGAVFQESTHVVPGDETVTADLGPTRLGLTICYDLRFPELFRRLALRGAEICAVPAAFTLHTGKDHWLPLLRARAIENQVFVLAAAQIGRHCADRVSYGKSCIVDPWGAVIAQVPDTEGIALADLDLEYLRRIRRELPCLEHIRLLSRE